MKISRIMPGMGSSCEKQLMLFKASDYECLAREFQAFFDTEVMADPSASQNVHRFSANDLMNGDAWVALCTQNDRILSGAAVRGVGSGEHYWFGVSTARHCRGLGLAPTTLAMACVEIERITHYQAKSTAVIRQLECGTLNEGSLKLLTRIGFRTSGEAQRHRMKFDYRDRNLRPTMREDGTYLSVPLVMYGAIGPRAYLNNI